MKVIIMIIAVNLISCDATKKNTEHEDIGKYAFKLLNMLSQTTKINYVNSFLTIEEIRDVHQKKKWNKVK